MFQLVSMMIEIIACKIISESYDNQPVYISIIKNIDAECPIGRNFPRVPPMMGEKVVLVVVLTIIVVGRL